MKSKSIKNKSAAENSVTPVAEYAPVSFIRILMSVVYDSLLSAAIAIGYAAIAVAIHVGIFGAPVGHEKIQWAIAEKFIFCVGLASILSSYFVYCWCQKGQTLGMKTWRIKVIDARSHQLISVKSALLRALTGFASLAFLGLGYWVRYLHPKKRTWHDLASQSQTILLKKN